MTDFETGQADSEIMTAELSFGRIVKNNRQKNGLISKEDFQRIRSITV